MFRHIRVSILFVLITLLGASACSTLNVAQANKPVVVINSPPSGSQFFDGDDVTVQSTVTDSTGVARVELAVDGILIATVTPLVGQSQSSLSVSQAWKATPGNHTLVVSAVNSSGTASGPIGVSVSVLSARAPVPSLAPTLAALIPTLTREPALVPTFTTGPPTTTPIPSATATTLPTTIVATPCSKPQIASFTLEPTEIKRGDTATLNWGAVSNANSAVIDNGIGGVPAPGSRQVRPDKNTTYTLMASGCGGTNTAQTSISVFAIGPLFQGIPEGQRSFQPKLQFNWSNRSGYDGDKYLSGIEIEIERNGSYQPFETTVNFELQGNGYENKKLFPEGKYKIRFRWWMTDRVTHQRVSFKSAWSVICFNYKDNENCR